MHRHNWHDVVQAATPRLYRKTYIENRESLPGNCSTGVHTFTQSSTHHTSLNCTGQLTYAGYQMHYDLGKRFRSHYVDKLGFLPSKYDPNVFYVRTTDSPRTIQSAEVCKLFISKMLSVFCCCCFQAQLLGFYPPTSSSPTQYIDIETIDVSKDDLYVLILLAACLSSIRAPNNRCPTMVNICNSLQNSSEWNQVQCVRVSK